MLFSGYDTAHYKAKLFVFCFSSEENSFKEDFFSFLKDKGWI